MSWRKVSSSSRQLEVGGVDEAETERGLERLGHLPVHRPVGGALEDLHALGVVLGADVVAQLLDGVDELNWSKLTSSGVNASM